MKSTTAEFFQTFLASITDLLGGQADRLARGVSEPGRRWVWISVATILAGGGSYGYTVGLWHAPLQAAYTAIKFPLLVFLTCGANAVLNGMLAQVLGLELSFRQTTQTILLSFALAALILGSLAPVILCLLWNTPPLGTPSTAYNVLLSTHVFVIAFAGVVGNLRLLRLLDAMTARTTLARATLICWLAGNLFLGSQLAWVLRPFVGTPGLPLQFLREHPLKGNFFEALAHSLRHLV